MSEEKESPTSKLLKIKSHRGAEIENKQKEYKENKQNGSVVTLQHFPKYIKTAPRPKRNVNFASLFHT